MRRTIPTILLLSLFALGCGGDDERPRGQRTGAQADSAGMMGMPGEEMVTPEESASAARDVQRHADSVRDAVRRASGPAEEERASAPARAASVRERYEACMAQARAAEAEARPRLEAACANIRNQPDR
jgi:hypothetical protein